MSENRFSEAGFVPPGQMIFEQPPVINFVPPKQTIFEQPPVINFVPPGQMIFEQPPVINFVRPKQTMPERDPVTGWWRTGSAPESKRSQCGHVVTIEPCVAMAGQRCGHTGAWHMGAGG